MSTPSVNYGWPIPTDGGDDNVWGAELVTALTSIDAQVFANSSARGYLAGLGLSTAGSSTSFGVALGQAASDDNTANLALASAYTKTTSSWAVGTASGSLDTGTIANSTWYHVWLIRRSDTGVVDVLTSLSATSPSMPANYDQKRRIGSLLTNGSAQWVKFTQKGDEFLWDVPVQNLNGFAITSSASLQAMTVPTGVQVWAKLTVGIHSTASGFSAQLLFNSPDQSASVASEGNGQVGWTQGSSVGAGVVEVRTDTSSQVRIVASSGSTNLLSVFTQGWTDRRGRDG